MACRFILREIQPEDNPALAKLIESAPLEREDVRFITRFLVEPYQATAASRYGGSGCRNA